MHSTRALSAFYQRKKFTQDTTEDSVMDLLDSKVPKTRPKFMEEKIFNNDDFLEPLNPQEKELDENNIDQYLEENKKVMYEIRDV